MNNIKFLDLLPDSLKNNKDVIKFSSIIDDYFLNVDAVISKLNLYKQLFDNTLEERFVDKLAGDLHLLANEGYRFAKNVDEKRELVKNSLILHKTKGTKYSLEKVLEILNLKNSKITEWFESKSNPFTFKIDIKEMTGLDEEKIKLLIYMIHEFKNIRSHIDYFYFENTVKGSVDTVLCSISHETVNLTPYYNPNTILNGNINISCACYTDLNICVEFKQ